MAVLVFSLLMSSIVMAGMLGVPLMLVNKLTCVELMNRSVKLMLLFVRIHRFHLQYELTMASVDVVAGELTRVVFKATLGLMPSI